MKKQELLKLIEKIEKEGIETVKKELLSHDIPKNAVDVTQDLENLLSNIYFDYLKVFLIEKDCVILMHADKVIMFPKFKDNSELKLYYRKIEKPIDQS